MDKQYTDNTNTLNLFKQVSMQLLKMLLAFYLWPWEYWYIFLLQAKIILVIVLNKFQTMKIMIFNYENFK